MGESDSKNGFRFLPSSPLSRESVLEAVHRLEKDSTRVSEELFWIHDLQGKLALHGTNSDAVLTALRSQSDSNTTKGAIAQHNAAVILTCLAIESKGGKCLDYWKDALKYWNTTNQNPIFWQFLEDRYPSLENDSAALTQLKHEAGIILAEAVGEEIWESIHGRDFRRVASITAAVSVHSHWLPVEDELSKVSRQVAADATGRAGAIIDRAEAIQKDGDKSAMRRTLAAAEQDFQTLTQEFDPIFECLGTADGVDWPNTKASVLRKLSIAYFNHVDDNDEALRLIVEATNLAKDPEIRSRLDGDWRHVQQSILRGEAVQLMESGSYTEAEQKLSAALPLATEAQKQEILDLRQTCRRARVFKGVDRSKINPTLYTLNGIGATFYGGRDYDTDTKSYVTTHWFTVIFLPIIPLASYRVSKTGPRSYSIYGQVPLSPFLKKYRWSVLAAIVLLIIWATIDSNTSSSSSSPPPNTSSGSEYSTAAKDAPPSSTPSSVGYGSGTSSPVERSNLSQESAAIEVERGELKQMKVRLDSQKQDLDAQNAALEKMQSYVKIIDSTYTADTIPKSVRDRYNSTIDDYNGRLPGFKKAVHEYSDAVEEYERRRTEFNARVQRYNASQ
jgi:tetratricopeptide (TPR) repeat protein